VPGIEVKLKVVSPPVAVKLAIDSYELVAATTPLEKLPIVKLSNSTHYIPCVSTCLNTYSCFVLCKGR